MARPKGTPNYLHHKASGKAFVRIDGKNIYLGFFGTKESKAEFDRVVSEWLANGRQLPKTEIGTGRDGSIDRDFCPGRDRPAHFRCQGHTVGQDQRGKRVTESEPVFRLAALVIGDRFNLRGGQVVAAKTGDPEPGHARESADHDLDEIGILRDSTNQKRREPVGLLPNRRVHGHRRFRIVDDRDGLTGSSDVLVPVRYGRQHDP